MPSGRFRKVVWSRWSTPSFDEGVRWSVPGLSALAVTVLLTGCGDRSRTLSPQEVLAYKREILAAHASEVSSVQVERLGRHPARTKSEIDAIFERLLWEYREEQRLGRALQESELKKKEGAES